MLKSISLFSFESDLTLIQPLPAIGFIVFLLLEKYLLIKKGMVICRGVQNRIPGRPGSRKSSTRFFGYLKF